jgi:hypothetical protein
MRLTLAVETDQSTDSGLGPRRTGAERLRTTRRAIVEPAALPSGSTSACPGREGIHNQRSDPRSTVSSRPGLSAGRRRRRRDAEVLLVVRRAEQGRGLLDGGRGVRSRS